MGLTKEESVFVFVFAMNFLSAVLYLAAGFLAVSAEKEKFQDDRKAYLLRFLVMIFCPVIGPLFYLASYLLYVSFFRFPVDLEDVIFRKDRVRTQIRADEERERNLIPAEEAVLVNDRRSLRMTMMNIIKGNMQGSLSSIALALDAEDSETAHYAASALSDILNGFRMKVHRMNLELSKEDPKKTDLEEKMLDDMDDVLKQRVFTEMEQNRFVCMMERTAELLYEKDPSRLTAARYEAVCLRLLEAEDFTDCEKWCRRQMQQYPDQLSSFTCCLKLYFTVRNRDAFFRTMKELKRSEVPVDSETLEIIRIFS